MTDSILAGDPIVIRKWIVCICIFATFIATGWYVNETIEKSSNPIVANRNTSLLPLSTEVEYTEFAPAFKPRQYVRISQYLTENASTRK